MWYTSNEGEVGMFWHGYESVWLPAFLLEKEQQSQLADTLFSCSKQWKVALHFNKGLGGGSAEAIAATKETAMNPQVLNAFALAIIAGGTSRKYPGINGYEPDLAFARADAHRIKESMLKLRSIVPEAGAYVSESSFFEHSWQQSFWGANYPRLSAAKKKYDPNGLFFVHHGVGSEEWSADGFTPNA